MFMLRNTTAAGRKLVPCSRGEWPYPQAGKKRQWLFGNDPTVFQTCVLGLPGQVKNFDSESSASHDEMRLLDLFATQSNKSNNIMINLDVCLEVLPWLDSSCLHRMVNQLESWKLKLESKDLLFIAFQQKENQSLTKPCIV